MARDRLVLFAKAPRPGAVKTRLAAAIGPEAAARLYEAFLRDLLAAHAGRRYELIVALDPASGSPQQFRRRLGPVPVVAQRGADLGERLGETFRRARGRRIVVAGTDLPDLSPSRVEEAFEALSSVPIVLGPCPDGGFYLVGMDRPYPIFRGVPWSTPRVLRQVIARARGRRVRLLAAARDVDTFEDFKALARRITPVACPATARCLTALSTSGGCDDSPDLGSVRRVLSKPRDRVA